MAPNPIFEFLLWSAVPMALILIWVLARTKVRSTSHRALTLLFATKLLAELFESAKFTPLAGERIWYRLGFPFAMAAPTLVYICFKCSIGRCDYRLRDIPKWHWTPFIFGWIYYFGFQLFAPPEFFVIGEALLWDRYIQVVIRLLVLAPYCYAIFRLLRAYSQKVVEVRSDVGRAQLLWLKWLWGMCLLSLAISLLDVLTGPNVPFWLADVVVIYAAVLGLFFIGVSTSRLFDGCELCEETQQTPPSNLDDLKAKFHDLLVGKRMYLMPRLRLNDLAEAMNVRPQKVSDILRFGYAKSFYDLVNQLRVEDAMRRIASHPDEKFLAIALDCGFNSKSTFNEVFRKTAGMTPSEYRRRRNSSELAHLDDLV